MTEPNGFAALLALYPVAKVIVESGFTYIYLPKLKVDTGGATVETDALLCLNQHSGYPTRLFLAQQIAGKGGNWTTHGILGRQWHTWSWNYVAADQPALSILGNHLRALR